MLAFYTWGTLIDDRSPGVRPDAALAELCRCLGARAKIMYGSEIGHSGFLTGMNHVGYNIMIPGLTEARHRVESLDWGQFVEFRKETDV